MRKGYLSQYFEKVAAKRLTSVEANPDKSNQHEFNGTIALKEVLGTFESREKKVFNTYFIWMGDQTEPVAVNGTLSWYNSRFEKPRAAEWRLYFQSNDVMDLASEGDLLIIAKRTDESILCIIAQAGSTIENQLIWLFGSPVQTGRQFVFHEIVAKTDKEVNLVVRFILEEIGIEIEEHETDYLDSLITKFNGAFPKAREFSKFVRQTMNGVDPIEDPDHAIIAWMEFEEKLFRRLERIIVEKQLEVLVTNREIIDVDTFISFSLSVHNRRKARAGLALENHLEDLFNLHSIQFQRTVETENKSKPDFLFPYAQAYRNQSFPSDQLTMLGVKTTCKDRWRQVLSEASRIKNKHLFTLEPGISSNQTDEMQANNLQLILPTSIHNTYKDSQRKWLMNTKEFLQQVKEKQKKI